MGSDGIRCRRRFRGSALHGEPVVQGIELGNVSHVSGPAACAMSQNHRNLKVFNVSSNDPASASSASTLESCPRPAQWCATLIGREKAYLQGRTLAPEAARSTRTARTAHRGLDRLPATPARLAIDQFCRCDLRRDPRTPPTLGTCIGVD